MKRLCVFLCLLCCLSTLYANNKVDVIYQGPYQIGNWGTVELSSIKFHDLEIGDTIYVFTSQVDSVSLGSFQDHLWHTIPGLINGQAITGDYEFVVRNEEHLNELKQYGLKIRGYNYTVEKVVIKHNDHTVRTILIISGCIIFLLILISISTLSYKNRQLHKAYLQLYARNMDVLASVDEEKKRRAAYIGQITTLQEIIREGLAGESAKQKYQNSTLADDDKTILLGRITSLFDTDEIFAEDFNMNKLATLINSNYKNVSQVINEMIGKNFNALLNEYRIKEACRRINDISNFGNYTIEAIGSSVGYGSRSTFVTQFKMMTGMTPSEFQQMARKQMQ